MIEYVDKLKNILSEFHPGNIFYRKMGINVKNELSIVVEKLFPEKQLNKHHGNAIQKLNDKL